MLIEPKKFLKAFIDKIKKHNILLNAMVSLTVTMFLTACGLFVVYSFLIVGFFSAIKEIVDIKKYGSDYKPEALLDFITRVFVSGMYAAIIIIYNVEVS